MHQYYNTVAGQVNIQNGNYDKYGNPKGNDFDLGRDGAFAGQTIAVCHFYTGQGFDFTLPEKDLQIKGFKVIRWTNVPPLREFQGTLATASQLWIISDEKVMFPDEHLSCIASFFHAGHGLMLWGDNDP
eukprot:PhF_6_TR28391/c0_g1_i1/m.42077